MHFISHQIAEGLGGSQGFVGIVLRFLVEMTGIIFIFGVILEKLGAVGVLISHISAAQYVFLAGGYLILLKCSFG